MSRVHAKAQQRAAFFDMDKTLVPVNTGIRYARWRVGRGEMKRTELLRILGWSLQYTFGLVDAQAVSTFAARTMSGIDEESFREECRTWVTADVIPLLTEKARREVELKRREGYVLAILSGSSPYAIEPLAKELGIEHILCSRLTVAHGRFTGAVEPPLAFAEGKVTLAQAWAEDHHVSLQKSVFYSDSISDLPMLEVVGEPRIINPDPRLKRIAKKRSWPIERW